MTKNYPLLRKVMEHIEAHPELWYQQAWLIRWPDCRTAGCFAGWTVLLSEPSARPEWSGGLSTACVAVGNGHRHVPDFARQLLGLNLYESGRLFDANNDIDRLRYLVDNMLAEEGSA